MQDSVAKQNHFHSKFVVVYLQRACLYIPRHIKAHSIKCSLALDGI